MSDTKIQEYEAELRQYAVEVTKWLVTRGVKPDEAQDTVQDVFVKMLETDLFIPPSKLRSWMYRVALNNYIDRFRRNKRYQVILQELMKELPLMTESTPDLQPYLLKLKAADQLLLQHYYYEEMSVKELSALTKSSVSKVKIDLYRARKRLRKILDEEEFDASDWQL